jgi:hypothetical protein
VEAGENSLLQIARKVDQYVAAEQQIDVGERRRLREVVRAEDAPAPDVSAESIELAGMREVAMYRLGRDVLQLVQSIQPMPGRAQRVLVDVGAVDLMR